MARAPDDFDFTWEQRPLEWLRSEWPGVVAWVSWGATTLAVVVGLAVGVSPWWWLALAPWWLMAGGRAVGLLGGLRRVPMLLRVGATGTMFVAAAGGQPLHAWWRAFVNQGDSWLLWGADGRYRLVIPRRAMTTEAARLIHARTGVDLLALSPGEEALLRVAPPS